MVVLVVVVVVVVCAAVWGVPVLRSSYVLREIVGVWGCAFICGCGVVVLGVVDFNGMVLDADVDSGVGADVDASTMWVGMGMCVVCVGGILGGVIVVVGAVFGCCVEDVVGGVFLCH